MKPSIALLCLIAAWMLTGCGLFKTFISQVPPVPTQLLQPCNPPSPPRDGHLITISGALIDAVSAYRECEASKADLVKAVKIRNEAGK